MFLASPLNSKLFHLENLSTRSDNLDLLGNIYNQKNHNFPLEKLFGVRPEVTLPPSNVMPLPKFGELPPQTPDLESDEEDDDELGSCSGKKKVNKGLKLLSVIVQDIVVKKQSTTYKEVANIILNDTLKNGSVNNMTRDELNKEEQNVKRRVYDALNVLISAGILIKEGKRVRKNEVSKSIKISSK